MGSFRWQRALTQTKSPEKISGRQSSWYVQAIGWAGSTAFNEALLDVGAATARAVRIWVSQSRTNVSVAWLLLSHESGFSVASCGVKVQNSGLEQDTENTLPRVSVTTYCRGPLDARPQAPAMASNEADNAKTEMRDMLLIARGCR